VDKLIFAVLAAIAGVKLLLDGQELNVYFYAPAGWLVASVLLDIRIRYDWYVVYKVGDNTLTAIITDWNDINDFDDIFNLRQELNFGVILYFRKIGWHIVLKRNGRSD